MTTLRLTRGAVSAIALLAGLEFAAIPRPADAQTAAGNDGAPHDLSEIVVTAERRESSAISTPLDITALTGVDLTREGVTTFQALAGSVPGLAYNSSGIRNGGGTNGFILHGLNLDSVSAGGDLPPTTFPPVTLYINETPTFVNLHLADVQRVEVLRGPQASLYGDASIAGTVRILFNQPDFSGPSAELSADTSQSRHASGPNYSFDAVINRPLSDNVALRVAAGYVFQNGFINAPHLFSLDSMGNPVLANPADVVHSLPVSVSRKNIDDSHLGYVRPMLAVNIDKFKFLLTYQHQSEHANGDDTDSYPGGAAPTSYSTAANPGFQNDGFDAAFPSRFREYQSGIFAMQPLDRSTDEGSVEASYDMGFATLTSVTSDYSTQSDATTDLSGFYQRSLGALYQGYPRLVVPSHRTYRERAFIEELRLVSKSSGPLTYSIGMFYLNQQIHLREQDVIRGYADYETALMEDSTGTDTAYIDDRKVHFLDMAAFGEATYHVTSKWQVTGGVRLFKQTLDLHESTELPICGAPCSDSQVDVRGLSSGGDREVTSKALFKINTSYEFVPHTIAYFTFSQGERRGGANGIPTKGPFAENPQFLFFKPDTVDNYELGLKGRLGGRVELSSAFYWIEWHNPQVNINTPVGAFPAAVNGQGARSRGVDFEGRYQVNNDVTLRATYSHSEAQLTAPVVVGGITYGASGTILPGTPRNTASIAADYEHSLSQGLTVSAHIDGNWRDNNNISISPVANIDLPAFAMLNASAGLSRGPWRVGLYATNLTNVRGVLSGNSAAFYDIRAISNRLSRPLTIGLRLNYQFDK